MRAALEWAVPAVIFVAMPKCPACVAAWIALATGVGVSFSAAAQLRMLALALCVVALACLAVRRAAGLVSGTRSLAAMLRSGLHRLW